MENKRYIYLNKGVALHGDYVLYVPLASHRVSYNFTLKKAIEEATSFKKPLLILYPLYKNFVTSTQSHIIFLFEGLLDFERDLKRYNLELIVKVGDPFSVVSAASKRAVLIVTDFPYLKGERFFIERIAKITQKPMILVEGNVLVPVTFISQKEELYARNLRPKILKNWINFFEDFTLPEAPFGSYEMDEECLNIEELLKKEHKLLELCRDLEVDLRVPPVREHFQGGYSEAIKKLEVFVREKLPYYRELRSEPGYECESNLSPYLRYGQISPIEILKKIFEVRLMTDDNVKSFFNELVVWRELARNFCLYNDNYDSFSGLPEWARKTLISHMKDPREKKYTLTELEKAEVDNIYWRASQIELLRKGKIHNYMRMYWCKRLLFWTDTPENAFKIALYLNNKYALDGEDPNTYLGVAWCFGAFDHPFTEREILGKVRPFSEFALKRKKSLSLYLKKWLSS
ncbi:deoxyribodipyrimidine photolyase [Caldimicrobium thiodismutans]|uniref:Deoxyribodipyrimidine photo-lyase n=1 Tax=Caldimicrobium thiodismutans TaxID=1653476 RepID=A0A0U5AZJ5_9BACT|nr:deoxyribodipyrimidine photo-lyase [Caldimicrobium thiodismutans]BAU23161.1 deoxyribodipyrimidine photolyase [Caldimicrobium thiodismutans]